MTTKSKKPKSSTSKTRAVAIRSPQKTSAVVIIEQEPPSTSIVMWEKIQQSVITENQFKVIGAQTPAYAIKSRQGGGGAIFKYVPHGYVRSKLNEAFGFDYDFHIVDIELGKKYSIVERKEAIKGGSEIVQYLVVLGELTVRLHDPKNPEKVIATIVKQDFGSQAWRASMEIGDALKAASSDALKRCGLGFGIALDLYFDDELAKDHWTKQQMKRSAAAKSPNSSVGEGDENPTDPMELLARASTELNLDAEQIEKLTKVSVSGLMELSPSEIESLWGILVKKASK